LEYIEELVKALSHENPEIRGKVAGALKALEDARATEPLIKALENERDKEVRRELAFALQWVADERALPTFIRLLEDDNESMRMWAAYGLGNLGDSRAIKPRARAIY